MLDFYDIPWEYEQRSFAIAFDDDGTAVGFFTPDFYLPGDDRFIEITTMNQNLVTKKNRKVRLLREHHLGINCKILYQRDYLNLLVKYGLESARESEESPAPTRMPGPPQVVNLGEAATAVEA